MKLRLAILIWLAGALAWPLCSPAMVVEDQVQLADGLYSRGLHEMAIREYLLFLEAATNHPRAAEVTFRVGECYRQLRNRVAAQKYYAQVESRYPTNEFRFRSAVRRAEMLEEDRKPEEARNLLVTTLNARPPAEIETYALYKVGNLMVQAGQPSDAEAVYQRIVAEHPGSPFYPYALLALGGLNAAKAGGAARAEELYRMAATNATAPRVSGEAWFQLADMQFRAKDYARSAEAYEKLFTLYPNDPRVPEARLQRAWSLYFSGLHADALRRAAEALALPVATNEPDATEEWLYLKANAERQLLKYGDSVATYSALLAKYPQGRYADAAGYERALALYKSGAFKEAILQARALVSGTANRKDLFLILAESHAALKEDDEAIQYYRQLVDQFPDSEQAGDAGYRLARLLQKKEQYMPAAELFGKVARRAETSPDLAAQALLASGLCLSKAGKQEEAVRDYSLLVEKYPQHALVDEAVYQKAMSEIFLRRDSQAMATLRNLLARPSAARFGPDVHFWLGFLLDSGGRLPEAESELRLALTNNATGDLAQRAQFQLALVLQKSGKEDEAAPIFNSLLATPLSGRMSPALLEWLAEHQLAKQQYAQAVEVAALLVRKGGSNAWQQVGYCLSGRGLLALNKTEEAVAAFEKARAIPGNSEARAESIWQLGELALQARDYGRARERFEEAANTAADDRLLPIRMKAYAGIARALRAQGDLAGAAKYFMIVPVLYDDPVLVPECLTQAAEVFKLLKRDEESAKALKELADRYPTKK